jgi:hypothetical protein
LLAHGGLNHRFSLPQDPVFLKSAALGVPVDDSIGRIARGTDGLRKSPVIT